MAGVDFEQRWLGLLDLLSTCGVMTVGDLAAALGISHPSVSQSRASLAAAGLISWEADDRDKRRRRLSLTAKGRELVRDLQPLWRALDQAAIEIDRDAGHVTGALLALERTLGARSLYDPVNAILAGPA